MMGVSAWPQNVININRSGEIAWLEGMVGT